MMRQLRNVTRGVLAICLAFALSEEQVNAATIPVTGWVTILGNAGYAGGSEATNSPVTTDARDDTIAANFVPTTLVNDGDSISLTGFVSLNATLIGNQFRWGLFDGDNPVTVGDGTGYVGYFVQAPASGLSTSKLYAANGTATNPVGTSPATVATVIADATGLSPAVGANTELEFALTVVKNGANADVTASIKNASGTYNVAWSASGTTPMPGSLTYDSVVFLMGGTLVSTQGAYRDIVVTTNFPIPEPASYALCGIGAVLLMGVRRLHR